MVLFSYTGIINVVYFFLPILWQIQETYGFSKNYKTRNIFVSFIITTINSHLIFYGKTLMEIQTKTNSTQLMFNVVIMLFLLWLMAARQTHILKKLNSHNYREKQKKNKKILIINIFDSKISGKDQKLIPLLLAIKKRLINISQKKRKVAFHNIYQIIKLKNQLLGSIHNFN